MKNLLEFLRKHFHWFLFVILEIASAILLFQYNSYQNSVWFSSANAVAGRVYGWSSAVEQFFSLTKINEDLTLRNFYLERQLSQLRRLYGELTSDTTELERRGLQFLQQYKIVPAKVVTNELNKSDNLMTINCGAADGVGVGMGVACGQGVVGVTYSNTSAQRHFFTHQLCYQRKRIFRSFALGRQGCRNGIRGGYTATCPFQDR